MSCEWSNEVCYYDSIFFFFALCLLGSSNIFSHFALIRYASFVKLLGRVWKHILRPSFADWQERTPKRSASATLEEQTNVAGGERRTLRILVPWEQLAVRHQKRPPRLLLAANCMKEPRRSASGAESLPAASTFSDRVPESATRRSARETVSTRPWTLQGRARDSEGSTPKDANRHAETLAVGRADRSDSDGLVFETPRASAFMCWQTHTQPNEGNGVFCFFKGRPSWGLFFSRSYPVGLILILHYCFKREMCGRARLIHIMDASGL